MRKHVIKMKVKGKTRKEAQGNAMELSKRCWDSFISMNGAQHAMGGFEVTVDLKPIKVHTTKKGTTLLFIREKDYFYAHFTTSMPTPFGSYNIVPERSAMITSEDGMQELTNFVEKLHWEY